MKEAKTVMATNGNAVAQRDTKTGQFLPGWSGGPGRKKGIPNKATRPIRELAQDYSEEAIEVLVSLMRNTELSAQARLGAARELLDRGFGRPAQGVSVDVDLGMGMAARDLRQIPTAVLERIAARAMTDDEIAALPELPGLPPG